MGEDVGGWGSQGLSGFRPFSLDHFDDYQKHFTVMNYGEGVQLKQVHYDEFIPMFEKQYPWKVVEAHPSAPCHRWPPGLHGETPPACSTAGQGFPTPG
ncbi:tubulin--tyrosine ligase-like protein 12 isoform X2 [Salmo salar]|uniref:Tubulin--tyrosine ligase-like protein 12 isoform X2 n=1 Tax=Salmo salar TaxID=8030 RepID=A0ABM3F3R1_SALSA|nr:tubulin--tyrosine ligase-like protein 12 isoform X2 [Salmo salar]|eukprot:XP_014063473.1 PREDICTED: tubulin--tyrosine ligase-like protein 12 [Salmo salar]